jgi:glycosyltransferase involved in cell wall biosynthesis
MHSATRKWAINGDFLLLGEGGVPRYALEVTRALDQLITAGHPLADGLDIEIIAPIEPRNGLSLRNISLRVVAEHSRPRLPQFWVQCQLPFQVKGGLLSFCNLGPVMVKRQIVCIHDLHTRIMPESFKFGFRLAHRLILPALGRTVRAITTVSTFARDHLLSFRVAPREKISITYNGHEHTRFWCSTSSKLDLGAQRPYVFCLGRDLPYKNTGLLWRIADRLNEVGLDVVIGGQIEPKALGCGSLPVNMKLLGRISDDDLANLLQNAVCFVFPSRIEGFGVPVVEAMSLGCAVVSSDAACLPEIGGDAVLYASPDDEPAWVAAITKLHRDEAFRTSLVAKGHERVKQFSWSKIAEQYLQLMHRIDTEGGHA